jgi:hypothetical protein
VLTWDYIPTATAPSLPHLLPMRLEKVSFHSRPLHLRPLHALAGYVRSQIARTVITTGPSDALTKPDAMDFGAYYPQRSDSRRASVIIVQCGGNLP